MKRKIAILLICMFLLSLLLSACGQKDIGEAKAKEIGLSYINKFFNANETEAKVYRDLLECDSEDTAAFSTNGDAELFYRWVYRVQVPLAASLIKYEVYIIAETGDLISARQHELNIILSDEQKERANRLYEEEPSWGERHIEALSELYQTCYDWSILNLDEPHPILLDTDVYQQPNDSLQRTFSAPCYVVTRDGRVYALTMNWPSLQVLGLSVINDPN